MSAQDFIVRTTSAASTRRLAAALAGALAPPCAILLAGPLGAGKTTFVQGFVGGLPGGAELRVQSPTFAFARTYPTTPPVHHLDLYRLEHGDTGRELGLEEMLLDRLALCCVEWPERAPALWRDLPHIRVQLPGNPSPTRRLQLHLPPGLSPQLPDQLRGAAGAGGRSMAR